MRGLEEDAGSAVRVSPDGGTGPVWGGDGEELFYLDDAGRIVAVRFESFDPPRPGPPEVLFQARLEEAADRQFDVTADGQRFILNRSLVADRIPITVVLGWQARLEGGPPR